MHESRSKVSFPVRGAGMTKVVGASADIYFKAKVSLPLLGAGISQGSDACVDS